MTNFTVIQNESITNIKISDGAYRCYLLLKSMCYGDKDTCYPSQKYLAVALGRSVRTIQRYIEELIKLRLIVKKRRGSISNVYIIFEKIIENKMQQVKKIIKKAKKTYGNKKPNIWNNYDQREYSKEQIDDIENKLLGLV